MKKSFNSKKFSGDGRGFFLAEAIIALSVLMVGFLGIISLLSSSLGLNRVVSDAYAANYLAMEGIEVAKNLIDAAVIYSQKNPGQPCGWSSANGGAQSGYYEVEYDDLPLLGQCPLDTGSFYKNFGSNVPSPSSLDKLNLVDLGGGDVVYGYASGDLTNFRRIVGITNNGEEITVSSIVYWTTRGGGSYSLDLEDQFWNWKPKP